MISFKGYRYPKEIILQAVRWYLAYNLSYRDIEELLSERGVEVDCISIRMPMRRNQHRRLSVRFDGTLRQAKP